MVAFLFFLLVVGIALYGYTQREYLMERWQSMHQKPFVKGQEVFISDLILSPQYNNLIGIISSDLDQKKRRFAIRIMYQEKFITVKPQNLSHLTDQKQIESILRNLAINERTKYVVNGSSDFIASISTEYGKSKLPPFNKYFNSSLRNYRENSDSVYCVLQYLGLFSSISSGHFGHFQLSDWNKTVDQYSAANRLRTFCKSDANINGDELSILYLEFSSHKMCILRHQRQFRVVQSMSSLCKYSLNEELNRKNWLNEREINNYCDALVDVLYGKSLNLSEWIFGRDFEYESVDGGIIMVVLEDLNIEMFIKIGRKMIKYISRHLDDNLISISVRK